MLGWFQPSSQFHFAFGTYALLTVSWDISCKKGIGHCDSNSFPFPGLLEEQNGHQTTSGGAWKEWLGKHEYIRLSLYVSFDLKWKGPKCHGKPICKWIFLKVLPKFKMKKKKIQMASHRSPVDSHSGICFYIRLLTKEFIESQVSPIFEHVTKCS